MPSHRLRRLPSRLPLCLPTRRPAAAFLVLCLLLAAALVPRASHGSGARAGRSRGAEHVASYARGKSDAAESVPGELLVRFRDVGGPQKGEQSVSTLALRSEAGGIDVRLERLAPAETFAGLRLARVAPGETAAALAALRARDDVVYAEPNYRRRALASPNDARYAEQWALRNTGQANGVAGIDIRAEQAWDTTTGSRDFVVAVIDEGVDLSHPDLAANAWRNSGEVAGNGADDDGNGYADDLNGFDFFHDDASVYDGPGTGPDGLPVDAHGTHVAGIVGAAGDNAAGVAGVAWRASLMSLKILGPEGGTSADAVRAYGYAKWMRDRWVATNGAQGANVRVANNSYGGDGYSQAEADAIRGLNASGILFVAAAGNEAEDNDVVPTYPASYDLPNVVSVSSLARGGLPSPFSNGGARTVHVAAPGSEILSTFPGGSYEYLSGTSMAAPHAAGAAALVLAAHPAMDVRRLRAALIFSGDLSPWLDGTSLTGRSLNASAALANAAVADATPPGPAANLRVASREGRSFLLTWDEPAGDEGGGGRAALTEIFFQDPAGEYRLAARRPGDAGSPQAALVNVPYRRTEGRLTIRVTDAAGNASHTSTGVSVGEEAAELYTVAAGAAAPLSTGGEALAANFDDYATTYQLPFSFPFFERYASNVTVSTNGTIYLGPARSFDPFSRHEALAGRHMIAGLWDDLDLRTSRRADSDIFVVRPNADRIIFRWQGVTFAGGDPVNFEVELRRDGTVVQRYGDGNAAVRPVVGIGGGESVPYVVGTHTSEAAPVSLTNAPALTYALRRLPRRADLKVTASSRPNPVLAGQNLALTVTVTNNGPDAAAGVRVTDKLPAASTFVSCSATQGACAGRLPGEPPTYAALLGTLAPGASASATFAVATSAAQQSSYTSVASASSATHDPNTFNNLVTDSVQGALVNQNPLRGAASVEAGDHHYLVLTADGEVLARGSNTSGQLGDGTATDRNVPVYVRNLLGVRAVAAGRAHSLALKSNGTVWAWGLNNGGQVGDGTQLDKFAPVQVRGLTNVKAVAAGAVHSMALREDGTVWTWGADVSGQLGDGPVTRDLIAPPAQVPGLANVVAIAAGEHHSVAIRADGAVWTWGQGSRQQLGYPVISQRDEPTQVVGLGGVVAAAAGIGHTAFLRSDGTVWACGGNNAGQLGDGSAAFERATPQPVANLSGVVSLSAGYNHTLALRSDGTVWAWGGNEQGQLGEGVVVPHPVFEPRPVQVLLLAGARGVAAGGNQSLAVASDSSVVSWGAHSVFGQAYPYGVSPPLARPALAPLSFSPDGGSFTGPQAVTVNSPDAGVQVASLAPAGGHVLALMSDGTARAWGNNGSGQLGATTGSTPPGSENYSATPLQVRNLSNVRALAGGGSQSVALKNDGTVWSWGNNWYGAAGRQTDVPQQVAGIGDAVEVAAGTEHTLIRRADGTVWAWGNNTHGQVGDGTTLNGRAAPVQVSGLANVTSIATGSDHSFALRSDGTLWAWGYNRIGQIGDGTTATRPAPVKLALTGVAAVATGTVHTVALKTDGTVWSWGSNEYGQLGDGTSTFRLSPVQVAAALSNIVAVAARGDSSLALRADGTVWAWGRNLAQFSPPWRLTPTQVAGLPAVAQIGCGGAYAVARTAGGDLWVWGSNVNGVFGNGAATGSFSQVPPARMDWLNAGVAIHYTLDGSEPTYASPTVLAGAAVLVQSSAVLKARALREGHAPGAVKAATYFVGQPSGTIQLSHTNSNAAESDGRASVIVTRTGDASLPASVQFATSDNPAAVRCDDTTTMPGTAFARCDYATTVETVTWAAGDASPKIVAIPLIDDGHAEGPEVIQFTLSNPAGGTLGTQAFGTITVADNDAAGAPNPIFGNRFFVRQHYLDFLSREPEAGEPWTGILDRCPDVNNDSSCDRLLVSQSFFQSPEFYLKALYAYIFYRVAFDRRPTYEEITPDMRSLAGATAEEVYAKRAAYAAAVTQRPEFAQLYGQLNNQQYVDALLGRHSLAQITTESPQDFEGTTQVTFTRQQLVDALNSNSLSRAQVLRAVVQSSEVDAAEYHGAFVAVQYYGYLRRTPEQSGYDAWLRVIKQDPQNIRQMVSGFLNSQEYALRFGRP